MLLHLGLASEARPQVALFADGSRLTFDQSRYSLDDLSIDISASLSFCFVNQVAASLAEKISFPHQLIVAIAGAYQTLTLLRVERRNPWFDFRHQPNMRSRFKTTRDNPNRDHDKCRFNVCPQKKMQFRRSDRHTIGRSQARASSHKGDARLNALPVSTIL